MARGDPWFVFDENTCLEALALTYFSFVSDGFPREVIAVLPASKVNLDMSSIPEDKRGMSGGGGHGRRMSSKIIDQPFWDDRTNVALQPFPGLSSLTHFDFIYD